MPRCFVSKSERSIPGVTQAEKPSSNAPKSVFGYFRRGNEPADASRASPRAVEAEAETSNPAETKEAPQPAHPSLAAQQVQNLSTRLGGWLASTATSAGGQTQLMTRRRPQVGSSAGAGLSLHAHRFDLSELQQFQFKPRSIGERLGVAAARGATAIQRLTGAEKYQVPHPAFSPCGYAVHAVLPAVAVRLSPEIVLRPDWWYLPLFICCWSATHALLRL